MSNSGRIKRVALILLVAGLGVGCGFYKKRSANKAIEKVERESVQQATAAQAPIYAKDAFDTLKQQISQAKRYVVEGQYDQAMGIVKEAQAQAEKAIREAGKTKKDVNERVKSIEKILADAEDMISKSRTVGAPGLQGQIQSAEERIGNTRELLKQQKTGAQEPKKYDAVIAGASEAASEALRVYDLVLEGEALAMEDRIRKMREETLALDPSKYVPEQAVQAMEAWSEYDLLMQSQKYAAAIEAGKALEESLPQFIAVAGRTRAEKTIEQAQADRDAAMAQGAGIYALDTLRVAEGALARAKNLFDGGDYSEAFETATSASQQAVAALDEVVAEAGKAVDLSKQKVAEAETESGDEFAPEILREARQYRADAALAYERQSYLESLQASDKALIQAGAAIINAKKGKAEQALKRTARAIGKAIEQDAAKYVPDEFIDAKATYDNADQAFRDGDFAGVHTLSKEAEDKAIGVLLKLREKTTEFIRNAGNAVELARAAQAPTLVQDEFEKSVNIVASAREKLAEESYKEAIERAQQAAELATGSRSTAFRIRTEAEQMVAGEEIDAANKAGASTFASMVLGDALDALSRSEKEYAAGAFEAALSDASEAERLAVRARTTLVDEAQAAVDSARGALAASYAKEGFFQAEELLVKAKSAMKGKDYASSNQSARQAAILAKDAEVSTWKARSEEKISYLKKEVEKLTAQLAPERAQEEWKNARLLLVDAEGTLPSGEYARTYVRAEAAEGAVSAAWAKLREKAEEEINVLTGLSSNVEKLALDTTGRQEWSLLFPLITKAKTAFEQGGYRTVFETVDAGKILAAQVDERVRQHNIASKKSEIEAELQSYSQIGVANLAPEIHSSIAGRVAAVDPVKAAADYDETMRTLEGLKNESDDLPRKADSAVDRTLAFAKRTLTEAQTAGALGFARKQYEASAGEYKYALGYPREGSYHELARLVSEASVSAVAALNRTMVAIDENDYRDTITDYMFQLTALLGRWPFANTPGTGKITIEVVLAARSTQDVNAYRELQRELTSKQFKSDAGELYSTILDIRPPASMAKVHREVVGAFRTVAEAADLFEKYGEYSLYPREDRVRSLRAAYSKLNKMDEYTVRIKAMLQGEEIHEKSKWDVFRSDRGLDVRNYMWTTYGD